MKFRQTRQPSDKAVTLTIDGQTHSARLVNVSSWGFQMAGVKTARVGQTVALSSFTAKISGQIVWARNGNAGVKLHRALMQSEISWMRGVRLGAPSKNGRMQRTQMAGMYREM